MPTTEAGRAAPTTEKGRALFTDMDPGDMWESNGVTTEDIIEVEQQAAAKATADLRRQLAERVREMPGFDSIREQGEFLKRRVVLAIIEEPEG